MASSTSVATYRKLLLTDNGVKDGRCSGKGHRSSGPFLRIGGTPRSPPQLLVRAVGAKVYTCLASYILEGVAKHLIDLDEEALSKAQAELGTTTIRDTVNLALQRATSNRHMRVLAALDVLASTDLEDRSEAWR